MRVVDFLYIHLRKVQADAQIQLQAVHAKKKRFAGPAGGYLMSTRERDAHHLLFEYMELKKR